MKNKARGGADGKSDTRHGSPKPREERTHMTLDELTEGVPVEAHEAITCEGELYRVHPAASEFDLLPDDQLQSLADDIALHGLDNAILRNRDGLILDGRNRLHACRMAGVTPRFRMYEGDDQVAKIISCNLERRHLNENERALMAVRMVPHIEAEADKGGRPAKVEPSLALVDDEKPSAILRSVSKKERKSTAQAARSMKVAPRRVEQMKRVVENAPDLVPEVTKGKMSLSKAESVVKDRQAGIEDHHRDSWYTPRWLFEQLGAMFEQDVCAPPDTDHRTCPANAYFTEDDDGLAQQWDGLVWCNPPYSTPEPWADRMVAHGNGLLLVHMPNNAQWAVRAQRAATAIRLIQSMHFERPNGQHQRPGYSLQLLAYGDTAACLLERVEGDMVGPLWVQP